MKLSVGNASEIDDRKGVKYVNSQIDMWRASPVGGHRRGSGSDATPYPLQRIVCSIDYRERKLKIIGADRKRLTPSYPGETSIE